MRRLIRQLIAEVAQTSDFTVTRPPDRRLGDWSSNVPLVLTRAWKQSPEQIGQTLVLQLRELGREVKLRVEARSGRLNFWMEDSLLNEALERAAREGAQFGSGEELVGQKVLVEFVSADPTGPLPLSAGRHALVGETICRLLEAGGARVTREFYLNDATNSSKIRALGEGVARWYGHAFGRELGPGAEQDDAWIRRVGADLARRDGAQWLESGAQERLETCSTAALEAAVAHQKATLEAFGVRFDDWISESSLRADGRLDAVLERLKSGGHTYERDGALWLATTKFGDEADRVLLRAGGKPTYFAGDIAYHVWKSERGFDRILNVWGAEHRPYIERTRAALKAAELDESKFEFLVCEGATLERDGTRLRLGTGGGALRLHEEMEELDVDALKFFFARTEREKVATVDLEVARRDDEKNPAYAVQLLPARLLRLERQAQAKNTAEQGDWNDAERELARLVALWSDEREQAAEKREPSRVAAFLLELSDATRTLLQSGATARLDLVRGAVGAARSALRLLNIEARERF